MSKVIMVQGTMSNVGKSLIVGGLCRIFANAGLKVAPFKSQNMALNSFVTDEGLEMGRAQVMQAECAKVNPSVYMNPILLKPTNDIGSQVIVNGKVLGNMSAREYFAYKKELIPDIMDAFHELEKWADIIVIEGAGSPAEINLKENDIVNMGMAALVDAPVLLVGDIDRGGVFAQLLGTLELLQPDERKRVKGLIINKFRGDKSLLDSGIDMLEEKGNVPVIGTVPYVKLMIDDEDSLSQKLDNKRIDSNAINISVIRLPHISNFTDLGPFESINGVNVSFVTNPHSLEYADIIIIPGSKNTIDDMKWVRESGMEAYINKMAAQVPVVGICGGFQMLGLNISDSDGVETIGSIKGLGLLPINTKLVTSKHRRQIEDCFEDLTDVFTNLSGKVFVGYEIHNGVSQLDYSNKDNLDAVQRDMDSNIILLQKKNILGTYVHGIFDHQDIAYILASALAHKKGIKLENRNEDYEKFKDSQYDLLAEEIKNNIDMDFIYKILEE